MADSSDAQLLLKKRARRRLVGAFAFAGLAAVVLPMVMDEEPKQQVQDVQIRIPGQEQAPFTPKALGARPATPAVDAEKPAPRADVVPAVPSARPVEPAPARLVENKPEAKPARPAEKPPEKAADKPSAKAAEKVPEKAPEKSADKAAPKAPVAEAQRAAAILGGKAPEAAAPAGNGQHVILIGAFANPVNVKQIQSKTAELGIKTYTESLDSPQGKKTRVRAGPFASREAAEKALEKMKRIGVSGVVAAKQ